jgi:hypothetical protein
VVSPPPLPHRYPLSFLGRYGSTLANIKATTIQKFFWQNIVCRFGVPRELTVDNGKQFDYYTFKEYCKTLGTQAKFLSVYHP